MALSSEQLTAAENAFGRCDVTLSQNTYTTFSQHKHEVTPSSVEFRPREAARPADGGHKRAGIGARAPARPRPPPAHADAPRTC
ncbi:hypothetical protein EVAR_85259_1 [Eumeta japonica]|uniref:Uncharacterized protein n=1 Tax=Eumeta variegata TaxID=151549 RepID=A0A4C1V795_EUMVA|nr:hypothetical protein EVAR_85259_1 [Eumeta japonica]